VAELVDALVSGTSNRKVVQVQVLSRAPSLLKTAFVAQLTAGFRELNILDINREKENFIQKLNPAIGKHLVYDIKISFFVFDRVPDTDIADARNCFNF
jgi:hypothetical protein